MRLAQQLGATPADTLARFRRVVTSTTKPPLPVAALLGEATGRAAYCDELHGEGVAMLRDADV